MTVRQSIEELIYEPPVGDLGYPADQRMVATILVGLRLLADSIDEIQTRIPSSGSPKEVAPHVDVTAGVQDLTSEIHDITEQVGKLTKIIKKAGKGR